MSALEGVSQTFDPDAWDMMPGFEDLTDLTYPGPAPRHRPGRLRPARHPRRLPPGHGRRAAAGAGARPHQRRCRVVLLTGNGPSAKNGKWAFCTVDRRIGDAPVISTRSRRLPRAERGRPRRLDKARMARLHILECQRLIRFMPEIVLCVVPGWAAGGGHSFARRVRPDPRERRARSSSRPTRTSAPSTAASGRPTSLGRWARSSPARSSSWVRSTTPRTPTGWAW